LIARFGHHLALNWNLGEEINNATTEQKVSWANYFWTQDPYQHHIVIHNAGDPHYDMLGDASALTGFSLQTSKSDFRQVHSRTRNYIDRSVAAGKPWVVACDEPGDASHGLIADAEDPTRDNARKNALWGNIMAGGAGVEWYFGYQHPHSDLTCQDYRTREKVWTQCRYALEFFRKHEIPFWDMKCEDELTENTDDYVFCKPGEVYLVYLKHGGKVELNVAAGKFTYGWFNPRTGDGLDGLLRTGSVNAGRRVEVAAPDTNDWLLIVRGSGKLELACEQVPLPGLAPTAEGAIVLKAIRDFQVVTGDGFVPAYKDKGHDALAINPDDYKDKFSAAEAKFTGKSDTYKVTLTTMAEIDGESTYKLFIGGRLVGQFTNPETSEDYKPTLKTWNNVRVDKGATIRVEFNAATNSKARQGNRKAYARGRWIALTFVPSDATKAKARASNAFSSDSAEAKIFEEADGLVALEAEHFAVQTQTEKRQWYVTSATQTPHVSPDGCSDASPESCSLCEFRL